MDKEYRVCSMCKRIFSEDDLDLIDGKWICKMCESDTFNIYDK